MELLRGDIIILDQESKKNIQTGLLAGVNDRTNREGEFPVDIVYIIPCTSKPESKILVNFLYNDYFSERFFLFLLARSRSSRDETCSEFDTRN